MNSGKKGVGGWAAPGRPKRFYKEARAVTREGGLFAVELDGRPVRAPGGAAFLAPRRVAEAAAAEWDAQVETVAPESMPVTRAVNTALEQIPAQRQAVIDEIAGYGAADLLCYRAAAPAELAEREAAAWDPALDWAAERYGARLLLAEGVMHVDQPAAALERLRAAVAAESDIGLAALSELTALSGSLVLALAVAEGRLDADAAWSASRVDEDFQIEQWGLDAEAAETAGRKRQAFHAAAQLRALLQG